MAVAHGFSPPGPQPPPRPEDRLQWSWHGRAHSDYRFDFWTALGWTVLSCGFYSYYVTYQLTRRMRDHNVRRLALLDSLNASAWQRAVRQGREVELRSQFERVAGHLGVMRQMTTDFRDPAIWLVICWLTSGIGVIVLYVLLDGDLVKHTAAEAAAEAELAGILGALGDRLPAPAAPIPKSPHQYGLRVVALFATCGLYSFWWLHDLMGEGNRHFDRDWAWEDAVVPVALAAGSSSGT